MEPYILSKIQNKNFSKATNEIYLVTDYNHEQYPEYYKWYYTKNIPRVLQGTGEVIFYLDGFMVIGLAILKKDIEEAKICTLMIQEEYRKRGYSKMILESAFDYLKTEQPLITISAKRLDEFSKIIEAYNWKESLRTNQYFLEEVVFNQPKKLVKNL